VRGSAEVTTAQPAAVLSEEDEGVEIGRDVLGKVRHEISQSQRRYRDSPAAGVRLGGALVERPVVPLAQRIGHVDQASLGIDVHSVEVHRLAPSQAREGAEQYECPEPAGHCVREGVDLAHGCDWAGVLGLLVGALDPARIPLIMPSSTAV
jgi:hypothetical protein